jgi:hypothetical protein
MSNNKIEIPEAFRKFGSKLYNGSFEETGNLEEWLSQTVKSLKSEDRIAIAAFLDQLLKGKHSDQELQRAWLLGGSDYGVRTQDYRGFLVLVRNKFNS